MHTRRIQFIHQIINFCGKLIEQSFTWLFFALMFKQVINNICNFRYNFILIFLFESFNTILHIALTMNDGKIILMNFIEFKCSTFGKFVFKSLDYITIFELLRHSKIINNGKHWEFAWDYFDYIVICRRFYILYLIIEAILL